MANKKVLIVEDSFPHEVESYLGGNSYIYCLNKDGMRSFREHSPIYEGVNRNAKELNFPIYEKPRWSPEEIKKRCEGKNHFDERGLKGEALLSDISPIDGLRRITIVDFFESYCQPNLKLEREFREKTGLDMIPRIFYHKMRKAKEYEQITGNPILTEELYSTIRSDWECAEATARFWQTLNRGLSNWMTPENPKFVELTATAKEEDSQTAIDPKLSHEQHCNFVPNPEGTYRFPDKGWATWGCLPTKIKLQFLTALVERTSGKSGIELLLVENVDEAKKVIDSQHIDYVMTDLGMPLSTEHTISPKEITLAEQTELLGALAPEIEAQENKYSQYVRGGGFSTYLNEEFYKEGGLMLPFHPDSSYDRTNWVGGIEVIEFAKERKIPFTIFTQDFPHGDGSLLYLLSKGDLTPKDFGTAEDACNDQKRALYGAASALMDFLGRKNIKRDVVAGISDSGRLAYGHKSRLNPWVTALSKIFEKIGS